MNGREQSSADYQGGQTQLVTITCVTSLIIWLPGHNGLGSVLEEKKGGLELEAGTWVRAK